MNVGGWLRVVGVTAVATVALAGCGGYIQDPWLSDGEAEILGDELNRSPETAKAIEDRLRHRVAGYGNY